MSDKIELLPCPFCGGIDIGHSYIEAHSCDSSYRVFGCISCGARFEAGDAQNWNRRAALAQQPAPAAPVAQEPVAFYWDDGNVHGPYFGVPNPDEICRSGATPVFLYTAPPAAEQPTRPVQALATISRMARNEACRSGAPAAGQLCTWDAIADMADAALADAPAAEQPFRMLSAEEIAVRELLAAMNRDGGQHQHAVGIAQAAKDALTEFNRLQQTLAGQPDTVAVPREALERAVDRLTHGHELDKACRELRALLAGGAE